MIAYSLLDEPLLSIVRRDAATRDSLSLPALFAALVRDEIGDFPALRPHQRHVWHALLVQLAALWLHRSGSTELPSDAAGWREALLSLTPDDPDGAAWALLAPIARPAFMQPPVPEDSLAGFKPIRTPADLDMLVTSNNHDVKRHAMPVARPEHWVYALVSLQTQEGFLGAGNYGVSRMNGGFASRPGLGAAPAGGPGRRMVRDVMRLAALRERLLEEYGMYPATGGHALLWLLPWEGDAALSPRSLDLLYIEVCRRVRLVTGPNGQLAALGTGTTTPRVDAKALKGNTGDPWTPLMPDTGGHKALTIDRGSFGYKRLVPLLVGGGADAPRRAALQLVDSSDDASGLRIVARGIVRGQGQTDGLLERVIPVSRSLRTLLIARPTDRHAAVAFARVEDAAQFARKVLFPAVLQVYTGAPRDGERARDDDTAKRRTNRSLAAFDHRVDGTFFDDLSTELDVADDAAAAEGVRSRWLLALRALGRSLVSTAAATAPSAAMRAYRVRARAHDVLEHAFQRHFGHRVADGASGPSTPSHSPAPATSATSP